LYCIDVKQNFLISFFKEIQKKRDKNAVKNIGRAISGSKTASKRISNIYNIKAELIYSPIDTSDFYWRTHKNYWLSVSRVDPYKRLEIQIEAFKKIPEENLIIIGSTSKENIKYLKKVKSLAPKNIQFYDSIFDRTKLAEFYAFSKGLICSASEEDFGMTVVEAMAAGKPVIAPNEGGYQETILNNETGKLINSFNSQTLSEIIIEYSKALDNDPEQYRYDCQNRADNFDLRNFEAKIKAFFYEE
jgi:glycosyltransferase involved in cell wall biosynthesis